MERRTIGVIVNPVAGIGGPSGLTGTDGPEALARARALGIQARSNDRAMRALAKIADVGERVVVITCRGPMGEGACAAVGLDAHVLAVPDAEQTSSCDTRAGAALMVAQGAQLILFAGGDGTARDVLDSVGDVVPILGVPTGVKMHSAVFATSPENAGNLVRLFVEGDARLRFRDGEVMDIDEVALRHNRVSAHLFGYARVPFQRGLLQSGKASALATDEEALEALAGEIVANLEPGRLYILGCGTTIRKIKRRLGFEGTLLGIDVVIDRRPLALNVDAQRLSRIVQGAKATIVTGVTGGQGYIFGRGNQQISPTVIRRVGRENIVIVTGVAKLLGLDPPCLRVDTGDPALDQALAGYLPVRTAPGQAMMVRVAA